jgi:4-hydroxy-3-methylbut-2-enyl diphosphate reductase
VEPLSGETFRIGAALVLCCTARSTDAATGQGWVVATAIGDGTGWVHRFAAAPLLAGALNRAGCPVQSNAFDGSEFIVDPAIAAQVRDDPSITAVVAEIGSPGGTVRDVLRTWSGLAGERQVLLAAPRSFCAGVERAVEIVERAIVKFGSPIYVRKQIVHNIHVVRDLERRGAIFVDELDEVPTQATVIFSAHGVAPAVRERAVERDLRVIDATCPLVSKVHSEARRFARRGDTIVLIGHAGHEESEGTLGVAPQQTVLVEKAEDIEQLDITGPVSFLTQTTLAVDEAEQVAGALRDRYPAIAAPDSDDICYATTNRQLALREIAADSDLVLVIGSRNSSNSLRLVEIAQRTGVPAYLIDSVADIELDWLADARTIGLTAGASAPPTLVDDVIEALRGLGPVTVTERRVADESIRFSLPKAVL